MSTTHGTTPRTITTKSGMRLPATIDQSTDVNLITTAMTIDEGSIGARENSVREGRGTERRDGRCMARRQTGVYSYARV